MGGDREQNGRRQGGKGRGEEAKWELRGSPLGVLLLFYFSISLFLSHFSQWEEVTRKGEEWEVTRSKMGGDKEKGGREEAEWELRGSRLVLTLDSTRGVRREKESYVGTKQPAGITALQT